jgi:hypothetical protein
LRTYRRIAELLLLLQGDAFGFSEGRLRNVCHVMRKR